MIHFELINLIDETDTKALGNEQGIHYKLNDDVYDLTVRLEALLNPETPEPTLEPLPLNRRSLTHKLAHVQTGLNQIDEAMTTTDPPVGIALLSQYLEEVLVYKKDLTSLHRNSST